jgi:hypothetical protein
MSRWDRALAAHDQAIEACVTAARSVPPERWNERGAGWSPSQELRHVMLSYVMVLSDLDGKHPSVRVHGLRQFVWRELALPIVLRTGKFPRIEAPREIRPPEEPVALDDAVAMLRDTASRCKAALIEAKRTRPRYRPTHPYFGPISVLSMLRLGNVHAMHHARKLAR